MSGGPRHKVDPLKTRRCVFPLPEVPWRGPWTSKKAQLQWLQDGRRQTMWHPALMGTEFWCFFWMCAFCCHQSDSKIIDHSKKPMKRYRIRVVWAFGLFLPFKKDIEGNQTWEYLHMIHVFLSVPTAINQFLQTWTSFRKDVSCGDKSAAFQSYFSAVNSAPVGGSKEATSCRF